jgi:hypothetical protein
MACWARRGGKSSRSSERDAVLLRIGGLAAAAAVHAALLPRILSGGWEPNWTLGREPVRLIEVPTVVPVGIGPCAGVRPAPS